MDNILHTLKLAECHLEHHQTLLDRALQLAIARQWSPDWIAGLQAATAKNEEAQRHLHNLCTCLRTSELPPP
ncbi:unnamed protein product [marine sediment metagenome]|uniref:Uncharacterized protein n=1 Tax=marine sediment metagenome TaxID=412755 RepID=X1RWX6_9ZZZZ